MNNNTVVAIASALVDVQVRLKIVSDEMTSVLPQIEIPGEPNQEARRRGALVGAKPKVDECIRLLVSEAQKIQSLLENSSSSR